MAVQQQAAGESPATTGTPGDLVAELVTAVGPEQVLTEPASVERYSRDQATWAGHGVPAAVVRPGTAEQVRDVVRACLRHGAPVVTRGAGSGLAGGANAVTGCVLVSTERMTSVLEVDPLERLAVVQPGLVNADLRAAVAGHGLWYPPDPASAEWSTVGGNVATDAGGLCCVKYGVTGDYVLGLQVVTGTGELVRLGRRTAKGVAGMDLTSLFVGSEGTLGVITEVTLRLRPARPAEHTVVGYFDSAVAAGEAVAAVAAAGVVPSAMELMDHACLVALDAWKAMGLSTEADTLLLARTDSVGERGDREAELVLDAFRAAGATWADRSGDEAEAEALFEARRLGYQAVERLGPVLTEDVCVPLAALPQMLARVQAAAQEHDLTIATLAHAGDGNLHPLIVVPAGDEAARVRGQAAFDRVMADALELGGTVTGEHGVGLLKRDGLAAELSPPVLAMQRAVKQALDPHGIMNPGKVWDG
ncbi:FAD-binding oxidoreductase [Jannaschia sp. R86511]|uniref:FAD-binding oxidoreductase n=1 Tax=Jannaschia sp. R86511 TaxID=3093853 RepID=UPI0036D2D88E